MKNLYDKIEETVKYIQQRINFQPEVGIVLGTGLGKLSEEIKPIATFDYVDLPHFPVSTVESHEGKLILGHLEGKKVIAMAGRFHYYEGYSMKEVTFPIRVMKFLGIKQLIISNAAGSTNPEIEAGDLVFVRDHINLHAENPLRGENDERLGVRFPDMMHTYDRSLNTQALSIAKANNIRAHEGVYVGLQGPNLETPAEYKFIHIIGGDLVGMSTIPEVIVARHMNLPVFVLSVISNKCFPIENLTPITIEEVLEVVEAAEPKARLIVKQLLK
ncbi:MAG: purine-nucleoside phosphorylase [Bacteroidota bacterium]